MQMQVQIHMKDLQWGWSKVMTKYLWFSMSFTHFKGLVCLSYRQRNHDKRSLQGLRGRSRRIWAGHGKHVYNSKAYSDKFHLNKWVTASVAKVESSSGQGYENAVPVGV